MIQYGVRAFHFSRSLSPEALPFSRSIERESCSLCCLHFVDLESITLKHPYKCTWRGQSLLSLTMSYLSRFGACSMEVV